MRNQYRFSLPLMGAAASLALAACTGETEPDTAIVPDDTQAVSVEAPGVQTVPEGNGAKSAETDQPTLGAGSVDAELGSPAAEPGMDQPGGTTVRANQGAANE